MGPREPYLAPFPFPRSFLRCVYSTGVNLVGLAWSAAWVGMARLRRQRRVQRRNVGRNSRARLADSARYYAGGDAAARLPYQPSCYKHARTNIIVQYYPREAVGSHVHRVKGGWRLRAGLMEKNTWPWLCSYDPEGRRIVWFEPRESECASRSDKSNLLRRRN